MGSKDRPTGALGRIHDPVVQRELAHQAQGEKLRRMPPAKRRKAKADARRSKATYDLPPELIAAIGEIAEAEGLSRSDVAAELLIRAINYYRAGNLVLDNEKQSARSLRWDWKITLSELDAG
jgi:ribosome-binding protein aMBF1 (putative translation factor)